ncbi:hypothetical protein SUGI_0284140 [Cryptomeria japonica]|nr:hypothetical protein SUGI_0284140 [Cryptomeria japonica]
MVFREETVRNKIWNQQNWFFGSAYLYLQLWQSNFDLVSLAMYMEPIWIQLYNLSMDYWGDYSLECIDRSLGMLLVVDKEIIENDSYLYARIKIVAVKKVPSSIFVKDQFAEDWTIFVKPAKKWVKKDGDRKSITKTVSPEQESQKKPSSPRPSKGIEISRECSREDKSEEKGVENTPQSIKSLSQKKGCSDG